MLNVYLTLGSTRGGGWMPLKNSCEAHNWLNLLTSCGPNLGRIGSNAIFCEFFSGIGLERPIFPGAEGDEIYIIYIIIN